MSRYKVPAINSVETISFLIENKVELEYRFHQFFPDLVSYVKEHENESDKS
jgi:hypothetical protein